jgi:hypothetical protein
MTAILDGIDLVESAPAAGEAVMADRTLVVRDAVYAARPGDRQERRLV